MHRLRSPYGLWSVTEFDGDGDAVDVDVGLVGGQLVVVGALTSPEPSDRLSREAVS
ncbi:hypothetical protein [Streptosporangium sp. CA-115845]|uniref:hypothetical protein n=1 Tax=Streptosporangium sp. CA-115845 TaxID=3240071 RepID=UPI003D8A6C85